MDQYLRGTPGASSVARDHDGRSTKRVRLTDESHSGNSPERNVFDDDDDPTLDLQEERIPDLPVTDDGTKVTGFENAMPETGSDEAIRLYEATKGAPIATGESITTPSKGLWVRGQRSIYIDAFNLALDTVLEDEAHLFDERERHVFDQWKALDYESQYLYVVSLRKSWHSMANLCSPVIPGFF